MITTFFRNQILPALKNFSNEDFCAWRKTRARTNGAHKILLPSSFSSKIFAEIFARGAKREHARTGAQNSATKLLFIEDFCRDFCARQEVCGFCDGNLQNVKDQILRTQTLSRRFLQRFLRVARNASTHERAHKILPPSSFSSKIFAEIFAQDKKCADFATGIYKT